MYTRAPLHSTDRYPGIPGHLVLIAIGFLLATAANHAASISYVGGDLNTHGAWRTPTVSKPLDANGDGIYGSDGYMLTTSPGGDVLQNPSYAAVTRLTTGTFYAGHATQILYQSVDNPLGGQVFSGLWFSSGTMDLEEQDLAEITVSAASGFRFGVLVDQCDYADISPQDLRLRQVAGGNADSGLVFCYRDPDLDADWYFFEVVGAQAGDKFVLSGTNRRDGDPPQDSNGIGAITFDRTETAVLEAGLYAGLNILGTVGTVYSIDYVTDLAQSNNATAWRCLEYLRLPSSPYLWADKSAPATGKRFYRAVAFPAPGNMVYIPPGTFRMGSPTNEVDRSPNEGPQTAVTISRGFWMGKYEVTQGEYKALIGNNPSYFSSNTPIPGNHPIVHYPDDSYLPVEQISWVAATNYCGQLTQRERAAGRIPTNCVYRLPTEAEWEYACRGWTSTRFSYGDDPGYTNLANYACYRREMTDDIGLKLPNPWGLYEMHGNVLEWCQDWYGEYLGGIAIDPQGPVSGSSRVVRGGWFNSLDRDCRSAGRFGSAPDIGWSINGFRVVLAPGQP